MDSLAYMLSQVENSDLPDAGDDVFLHPRHHPNVWDIQIDAGFLFSSPVDGFLFDAIDTFFHTYGYFIFPGGREEDGTEIACIRTKKGVIAFW